jgi:transposase-like protein
MSNSSHKGCKINNRDNETKKRLASEFLKLENSMSMSQFAKQNKISKTTLSDWCKNYKEGKYDNLNSFTASSTRKKTFRYGVVEDHLVQYIKTRRQLFTQDKLGLSWLVLKDTAIKYASIYLTNEIDKQDFSASSGWLNDVLKRNELIGVKLHGEAAEKSAEEVAQAQLELNARIEDICAKHNITRDRIYNTDQTGLYY